ncbi:MAG: hypothetical protein WBD55_11150 [Dehalococcoidia bacterium]
MINTNEDNLYRDMQIGICVDYGGEIYALANIEAKANKDIVVWQNTGKHHQLRSGKKWDPHVTYHGKTGTYHVDAYKLARRRGDPYPVEQTKQPLDSTFSGFENIVVQSFARDDARKWGSSCDGSHRHVLVSAAGLAEKCDVMEDRFGEVKTQLPTAAFQIDILEPKRPDIIAQLVSGRSEIICQELVDFMTLGLVITVFTTHPHTETNLGTRA